MTELHMAISIKKNTLKRLHDNCRPGEKHDNLIHRLLDTCLEEEKHINLSDDTVKKLKVFTGCNDVDEALNLLLDKYSNVIK